MVNTLLTSMRIPFLALTPVSLLLAAALAYSQAGSLATLWANGLDIALLFGAALCAHISVNLFNEYFDFQSGLDARTERTPFSGGSGALIENPDAAKLVFGVALLSLAFTVLIGLYFTFRAGWLILALGLLGVVIILSYTQWLNRLAWLCLIAPGLSFGPLMVVGSYVVLSGGYSPVALWAAMLPFFLVNNLLLLNQLPDIAADKTVGRRHFPIVYGVVRSLRVYAIFGLSSAVLILLAVVMAYLPALSLISLLPLLLVPRVYRGVLQHAHDVAALTPYLGMNVALTLLSPTLLALALVLA